MEKQLKERFTTFYYQQAAFEYQKIDPFSRVFPYEAPNLGNGRRHFLCARPEEFHAFYKQFKGGRWFYELIQEGYPCRPYFDLEFDKCFNPHLDPLECFQDFISICKDIFNEELQIKLHDSDFMILDSTTDIKFSAHVIIHLPGQLLFPSNTALNPLIAMICGRMLDLRKCIIKKKNNQEDVLCDRAVYTKNRNFRLYYSSKYGKTKKLLYAKYCKFYIEKPQTIDLFFDTLVVPNNVYECKIVDVKPLVEKCQSLHGQVYPSKSVKNFIQVYSGLSTQRGEHCQRLSEGIHSSPFPELDDFILKFLRPNCPNVQIRKWELTCGELTGARRIDYQFNNCRFCYRLGREHKSQNIFFSFYIESSQCYQRCFDHECKGFSQFVLVPYQIGETVKEMADKI